MDNKVDKTEKFRTGIEDHYIIKNNKRMQFGYTTGTCAAAASKAAARMILMGERPDCVTVRTPKGIGLILEVLEAEKNEKFAACGIVKDGGDDPDATHGLIIKARVELIPEDFIIDGGKGVGRVTKPGLEQPVGAAAINSVPRRTVT